MGVVEAINKVDGTPFDEDDLFLLSMMSETASNALHNASLLQAERKVEILEALVQVSHEITSTLDLERVLQAVVNGPQTVIPYERCALALEQQGRFRLRAVSGSPQVNLGDPGVARLNDLLLWASGLDQEIHVSQHDDRVNESREETRAKFERYFGESGMRGFYSLPLSDDQGRLGILSLESSDPDFLSEAHLEMLKVLAGQATVALRNASLYREVPFIAVLEPLLLRKRKFMALEERRRKTLVVLAVAVVAFLVAIPLPMRVDGEATAAPARVGKVQPEIEGVIRQVHVRADGTELRRAVRISDNAAPQFCLAPVHPP